MKREALIRKLRKQARKEGVDFWVDEDHGKGSHYTIHYNGVETTIMSGELKPGYVKLIMKQLGIT